MIYLRQTILNQIKSASDEKESTEVINNSIQKLRMKNVNGHIIQRFISGMGHTLQGERTEKSSTKTLKNMDLAIAIFRKLQKP